MHDCPTLITTDMRLIHLWLVPDELLRDPTLVLRHSPDGVLEHCSTYRLAVPRRHRREPSRKRHRKATRLRVGEILTLIHVHDVATLIPNP